MVFQGQFTSGNCQCNEVAARHQKLPGVVTAAAVIQGPTVIFLGIPSIAPSQHIITRRLIHNINVLRKFSLLFVVPVGIRCNNVPFFLKLSGFVQLRLESFNEGIDECQDRVERGTSANRQYPRALAFDKFRRRMTVKCMDLRESLQKRVFLYAGDVLCSNGEILADGFTLYAVVLRGRSFLDIEASKPRSSVRLPPAKSTLRYRSGSQYCFHTLVHKALILSATRSTKRGQSASPRQGTLVSGFENGWEDKGSILSLFFGRGVHSIRATFFC